MTRSLIIHSALGGGERWFRANGAVENWSIGEELLRDRPEDLMAWLDEKGIRELGTAPTCISDYDDIVIIDDGPNCREIRIANWFHSTLSTGGLR